MVPLHKLAGACGARMSALLAVPDKARSQVKRMMREPAAQALRQSLSEDVSEFVELASAPDVQAAVGTYVAALKKKSAAKKASS